MANTAVNVTVAARDTATAFAPTSIQANNNAVITWDCKDESTFIYITNSGGTSASVNILAGNGVQGVCPEPLSIAASTTVVVPINSGRFKNTYGTNVGKVVLECTNDVSVGVVTQGYVGE